MSVKSSEVWTLCVLGHFLKLKVTILLQIIFFIISRSWNRIFTFQMVLEDVFEKLKGRLWHLFLWDISDVRRRRPLVIWEMKEFYERFKKWKIREKLQLFLFFNVFETEMLKFHKPFSLNFRKQMVQKFRKKRSPFFHGTYGAATVEELQNIFAKRTS